MSVKRANKKFLTRVYLVYFTLALLCFAVVARASYIYVVEGSELLSEAQELTLRYKTIDAVRGNIYAEDGSLLATSVPIYEVRFDACADAISNDLFYAKVDSLAEGLERILGVKSKAAYKDELIGAREGKRRYHLIKRKVNYSQLVSLKKLPLFKKGRYKGGFIYIQENKRSRPFRTLAARTIGYSRDNVKVGLEGAYDELLGGVSGQRLMQKLSGGVWMPMNDENEVEPKDGFDIYSTIDINIQDVAENALEEKLKQHNADHGTVVLMEVKTGDVKAIANLSKSSEGEYYETYNHAIGSSTEPGSTFKLMSLVAVLEDGLAKLTDSVETGNGSKKFYDRVMKDSKTGGYGKITLQRAFEVSSNIGIASVIDRAYGNEPQKFIDALNRMGLAQPTNIEIAGEGKPYVKDPKDPTWSGTTLPWMSHGYELQMTPLQVLAFYNAIANDGIYVKPRFVQAIKDKRNLIEKIEPELSNKRICSVETIEKVKMALEGVVENGTADNLKNEYIRIAGKTGTAKIYKSKTGYKELNYQASFVGYFPAENPQYSCIVVVNAPSDVYYGNMVAGPIFQDVAAKVYATSVEIHDELAHQNTRFSTRIPYSKNGRVEDLTLVMDELEIPYNRETQSSQWAVTQTNEDVVEIKRRNIAPNQVPNVKGMTLRDALYILENEGLKVQFDGFGVVSDQSIQPGAKINKGSLIKLKLVS
ncbi:MAG: transpeptidase family protein [Flavobacteriales bacterium]|nr:transpeptidase family protein [Flavobacteriales bacterium]